MDSWSILLCACEKSGGEMYFSLQVLFSAAKGIKEVLTLYFYEASFKGWKHSS